ncbi:hypothetical protein MycrhDRAFT_4116 [Mycolicibacterium rhodesiae JS60]|nr:hypothetical protein MycrhDRAFT_4116 [Mycolicibacterium rhodesiae JS60]
MTQLPDQYEHDFATLAGGYHRPAPPAWATQVDEWCLEQPSMRVMRGIGGPCLSAAGISVMIGGAQYADERGKVQIRAWLDADGKVLDADGLDSLAAALRQQARTLRELEASASESKDP